jgi:hypothetical protein
MQREPRHEKVPFAENRGSSEGQEKRRDLLFQKDRNVGYVRGVRRSNAIHEVRIVCDRVAGTGVLSSRRFDNLFSLEARRDVFAVMSVRGPVGMIQKGDFTDTVVSFDLRQRGAKLTFSMGLELHICLRVRVRIPEEHLNILIRRNPLCTTTGNGDDRSCR